MQGLITALIVLASAGYAAWTLMPAAARRTLTRWVLRREPAPASSGCAGCDGGCAPSPAAPDGSRPITLHRRLPR
jgi:hypothetical protein